MVFYRHAAPPTLRKVSRTALFVAVRRDTKGLSIVGAACSPRARNVPKSGMRPWVLQDKDIS